MNLLEEEINVGQKNLKKKTKQDWNNHVEANNLEGKELWEISVISDFRTSNKRIHCNTDRNIVQSKRRVGGHFGVVVYASLPALRREKSINCSGESERRKAEKGSASSEPSR